MKLNLTILYILISFQITFSQSKPELPVNFSENFKYVLPENFNYSDSLKLEMQMNEIGAALLKHYDEIENNYQISDETNFYYYLLESSEMYTFNNKNQKVVNMIEKAWLLKPNPYYSLPVKFTLYCYNKTKANQNENNKALFIDEFHKILIQNLKALNPSFQKDIINRLKGTVTTQSTEIYNKNLSNIFNLTIEKKKNVLDFENANALLANYQYYKIWQKYRAEIEKTLLELNPSIVKEQNIKIPMRDGIKLSALLFQDETIKEKLPVIVALSPYPSGNLATRGNVFATNGYVYLYVDNRGRRESEGEFIPYENDAQDYYDIIDWASKQPWCNGKVATSGGSYLGFAQWQTIRKEYKHPALKAINPMVSVGFGVDFPRESNLFYPYILQWANFVSGKELNQQLFNDTKFWSGKNYELYKKRIPFAKLDSVAGLPNPIFQKWVSHPDFDGYWKGILPKKEDYKSIEIPIFSITGYYDADQAGALYYYNQHMKYGTKVGRDKHTLLIGPYDHSGSQWIPSPIQSGIEIEAEAQIPIYKYVIDWFDWVLKEKAKPEFVKGKINYFETGKGKWKSTETLGKLAKDSIIFYLSNKIIKNKYRNNLYTLTTKKSINNSKIQYNSDISLALDSTFLYAIPKPFDDSLYMVSPYNVVFESSPLAEDIIVSDKIISKLYMNLNVPDADYDVTIKEITPDGKDHDLASSIKRVRYRNSGENPQLAKPNETLLMTFDNNYVYIKKIKKGSKIRLIFKNSNDPYYEKNYGFGGVVSQESTTNTRMINTSILLGPKTSSRIVIPFYRK